MERLSVAEAGRDFANLVNRVETKNDPSVRLVIESRQSLEFRSETLMSHVQA